MLVLSRRKNQQILFPNLGIEVEIRRISGKTVSVGVIAPKSVEILRGELAEEWRKRDTNSTQSMRASGLHDLRNELNQARLAVAIAQKQLKLGRDQDAEQTLEEMVQQLNDIERQLASNSASSSDSNRVATLNIEDQPEVLIVEDEDNERALLAGYLRLCGFLINEARDGVEALEFLSKHTVDLVVLDMRMPRMRGSEVAKAIRKMSSSKETKIVVVSGEDRDDSLVTGDNTGVDEWFSKPFDPDRLTGCLQP
ncbi:response regulator [Gimesia benthica]|uniref:Response regulator n=1 Tax=Gimesia benthica TaxID=2608982 RepID=A0A6I6AKR4_9PLAN|nr:response regulator [Gimesia benthica]QGQ25640.1 response regulator [Gimesia benthica]